MLPFQEVIDWSRASVVWEERLLLQVSHYVDYYFAVRLGSINAQMPVNNITAVLFLCILFYALLV